MPIYEFECEDCGHITEILLGLNDPEKVLCENCHSNKTHKIISQCAFFTRDNLTQQKLSDKQKIKSDMQTDLLENYGVAEMQPLKAPGRPKELVNEETVYKQVKDTGGYVKEAMKATMERNEKKQREKSKEWKKKMQPLAEKRGREKMEMRKKEQYEKNKIEIIK